jgi:hypothetical protein
MTNNIDVYEFIEEHEDEVYDLVKSWYIGLDNLYLDNLYLDNLEIQDPEHICVTITRYLHPHELDHICWCLNDKKEKSNY